jgi:hypothetical protein
MEDYSDYSASDSGADSDCERDSSSVGQHGAEQVFNIMPPNAMQRLIVNNRVSVAIAHALATGNYKDVANALVQTATSGSPPGATAAALAYAMAAAQSFGQSRALDAALVNMGSGATAKALSKASSHTVSAE